MFEQLRPYGKQHGTLKLEHINYFDSISMFNGVVIDVD